MAENLLAQTVRLALRIAIVWSGGFILAVAVRALLPGETGITFPGSHSAHLVPYNRMGFWTCLLAALTVSGMIVVRSMLVDFGLLSTH